MVYYECFRCGYNTKQKTHFINHLNRKKICNPIYDDMGIEEIKDIVGNGFILMPTCPILAPEINKLENDKELFHRTNLKVLRNTMFGNFFNMPGLTLPTGKSNIDGRYSAILISSQAGSDNWLLKTGQEIQQVLDIW